MYISIVKARLKSLLSTRSSILIFLISVSQYMSDTQIDNLEMGYMFEELIRRFSEQSNETAGEHFTPREVIELKEYRLSVISEVVTGKVAVE